MKALLHGGRKTALTVLCASALSVLLWWVWTTWRKRRVEHAVKRGRVALCFWGLSRSLQKTITSIQTCLVEPLVGAGFEVNVYMHTWIVRHPLNNIRTGEKNCSVDPHDWKAVYRLRPLLASRPKIVTDDQDTKDPALHLLDYRTKGDAWKNGFVSTDNHVRALYSLHRVTELVRRQHDQPDVIIFARPDCLYDTPFQPSWLDVLRSFNILLPDFHKHPVNDRFAVCVPRVAYIYGQRYDKALAYAQQTQLHAETFLATILKMENIQIIEIPMHFMRLRACADRPNAADQKPTPSFDDSPA